MLTSDKLGWGLWLLSSITWIGSWLDNNRLIASMKRRDGYSKQNLFLPKQIVISSLLIYFADVISITRINNCHAADIG